MVTLLSPMGSHVKADPATVIPAAQGAVPWAASTHFPAGTRILVGASIYAASVGGETNGTAPVWSKIANVTDNGVTWVYQGPATTQILPPGYVIPSTGADTRSLANRPWTQRGRAQYIGRPICESVLQNVGDTTTPSYFDVAKEDPHPGGLDVSLSLESGSWSGATVVLERCFNADSVDDSGGTMHYGGDQSAGWNSVVPSVGAAITAVWKPVATYAADTEVTIEHYNASVKWRLRLATNASSAVILARLSQV
jgi:hypothetical protein